MAVHPTSRSHDASGSPATMTELQSTPAQGTQGVSGHAKDVGMFVVGCRQIHTVPASSATAMTPMIMSMFEAARGKRFKAYPWWGFWVSCPSPEMVLRISVSAWIFCIR